MPRRRQPRISGVRSPTTLEYLRRAVDMSQQEVANVSGLQQSLISEYEGGSSMVTIHARILFGAFLRIICDGPFPPEQSLVSIMNVLDPSDLPRSWEHVEPELQERLARGNDYNAQHPMVA
jgi:transcriptional regulator with XRE-family HTH domain